MFGKIRRKLFKKEMNKNNDAKNRVVIKNKNKNNNQRQIDDDNDYDDNKKLKQSNIININEEKKRSTKVEFFKIIISIIFIELVIDHIVSSSSSPSSSSSTPFVLKPIRSNNTNNHGLDKISTKDIKIIEAAESVQSSNVFQDFLNQTSFKPAFKDLNNKNLSNLSCIFDHDRLNDNESHKLHVLQTESSFNDDDDNVELGVLVLNFEKIFFFLILRFYMIMQSVNKLYKIKFSLSSGSLSSHTTTRTTTTTSTNTTLSSLSRVFFIVVVVFVQNSSLMLFNRLQEIVHAKFF